MMLEIIQIAPWLQSLVKSEAAMHMSLESPVWSSCCLCMGQRKVCPVPNPLPIAMWPALPLSTWEVSCTDSSRTSDPELAAGSCCCA